MDYEQIAYEPAGPVAVIRMNRPDRRNAHTRRMGEELRDATQCAEADAAIRAMVLSGAPPTFCSGADIDELTDAAADSLSTANPAYFRSLSKPIIAAINGPAIGLGLILAISCDIRFCSDTARFAAAFARRGAAAEYGSAWLLPRIIGLTHALDMLLSARVISAIEAERMGLVSRVIPADRLLAEATAYAHQLATQVSPRSLAVIKRQVYADLGGSLAESIASAAREMREMIGTPDFIEGLAHFTENRPPNFTGSSL